MLYEFSNVNYILLHKIHNYDYDCKVSDIIQHKAVQCSGCLHFGHTKSSTT